jgi:hypothetical protein
MRADWIAAAQLLSEDCGGLSGESIANEVD